MTAPTSPAELAWIELGAAWGAAAAVRVSDDAPARASGLPAVDAGELLARLHPDERAAGAALPIARRREWAAGRYALRAALERAGEGGHAPIGADDRGAPRVAAGWIGAISHKRGLAIAVAGADRGAKVGVDVELDAPSRVAIEGRVLTAGERAVVDAMEEGERGRAIMLRFAIKEAIYKAIDPYVRRYVGFQEVELVVDGERVEVASGLGLEIEAAWTRWHDCVIGMARATRP